MLSDLCFRVPDPVLMSCQAVWLAPETVAVAMERKELLRYQGVLSQPKEGGRKHRLQGSSAGFLGSVGLHRAVRFRMRAECSWMDMEGCLLHQWPMSCQSGIRSPSTVFWSVISLLSETEKLKSKQGSPKRLTHHVPKKRSSQWIRLWKRGICC